MKIKSKLHPTVDNSKGSSVNVHTALISTAIRMYDINICFSAEKSAKASH